jgi:tyrosinase
MTFIRRNVWGLGGDWADEILWYARGVAAMKARALAQPTSWRFYAGMHGFNSALWQQLGYLLPTDQPPSQAQLSTFWSQCQHGSWYFLPWHRGYVLALEANIRAEVVALNGPDDWALPYWNYFAPNEAALPPAFAGPDWPDGVGDNPLFVEQRYGPNGDGDVFVPTNLVDLNALGDPEFTGVSSGGSPGFGGVDTGFSHSVSRSNIGSGR